MKNEVKMNTINSSDPAGIIEEIDCAISEATRARLNQSTPSKPGGLARALRVVATILIVGAGAVFLFQGWSHFDSVMRILSFLGFAALLGVTGVLCAFKLKEDKGARTALILSCALVPVIASQIGALIYSLGHSPPVGPSIFILRAVSQGQVFMIGAASVIVLLPLIFTAFSVVARSRALLLTVVYALANAVLLIPIRDPNLVGGLALALLAALVTTDLRFIKSEAKLLNFEGRISRTLPFLPLVLIIGRNLTMYSPSAMLFSAIFAGIGSALFFVMPKYVSDESLIMTSQASGATFLCSAWAALVHAGFASIGENYFGLLHNQYYIPCMGLPMAAILILLSLIAHSKGEGYRILAGLCAVVTVILHMAIIGGILSSVLCLLVAIVLLSVGYMIEDRAVAACGVIGIIVGLTTHLRYAIVLYTMNPWVSLALLGIVVLIASSYLERNYEKVQGNLKAIALRFRATR